MPPQVVLLDFLLASVDVLKESEAITVDPEYLSAPRAIEFPTEGGLTAHAFFYPPANKDFAGPADERPPLIVMSHGGPDVGRLRRVRPGDAVLDEPRVRGRRRELRREHRATDARTASG